MSSSHFRLMMSASMGETAELQKGSEVAGGMAAGPELGLELSWASKQWYSTRTFVPKAI